MKHLPSFFAAASAAFVFTTLHATPAAACGGLFCSNAAPVVQTDENIIFVEHEDGTVTAVVQIFYQGPSERFAWVLPVPGEPEIGISSNQAFTDLRTATEPSYQLETEVIGECGQPVRPFFACDSPLGADESVSRIADAGPGGDAPNLGIQQGDVGPYDYTLLIPSEELEDPADVALTWLADNEYDIEDTDAATLRPYLEAGMNLLAFKLQKDGEAGDIRPVTLRYSTDNPMVPIKPTARAALPGMGVRIYMVAAGRAIPKNYRHLEINDARLNWFDPAGRYRGLIDTAADEAGGHGFVTELSQPSSTVADVVFSPSDGAEWESIRSGGLPAADTLDRIARTYTSWDGLLDTVRDLYDLADTQAVRDFLNCVSCEPELASSVERDVLLDAIDENVVEPMRKTQQLLGERGQLTRLFTTMSPDEMDEDPVFDINADRPDVSNIHVAQQVVQCHSGVFFNQATWNITLPSGFNIKGDGFNWPNVSSLPANRLVLQEFSDAAPDVIEDHEQQIRQGLADINRDAAPSSNGSGNRLVAFATATEGGLLLFSFVVGNFLLRRRRRAR